MSRGAFAAAALASALLGVGCSEPQQLSAVARETGSSREILTDLTRWDAATSTSRRAAAEDVARRLPDFALLRMETFSCGGQTHEVAIYAHAKTGMEFVLVPGGTFVIGFPPTETNRFVSVDRQHTVTLTHPFLLARTETTQTAWKRVMETDPSRIKGADRPVEMVSWEDATACCAKSGLELPTEAQWERACRAGTTTRYYFGDDDKDLGDYAWYESDPNSAAKGDWSHPSDRRRTHPVGEKTPNAFGLFDMLGNVSESCADMFSAYPTEPVTDPTVPMSRNRADPVHRGGCWGQGADGLRAAHRACDYADHRDPGLGFRPAKTVPTE